MLRFNDGVEIRTDGELRTTRKSDGLYVVGNGMCIPVDDEAEAQKLIKELKGANKS